MRTCILSLACLLALAAPAAAQAPVTSGLGAITRANEAVGTVDAAASNNAAATTAEAPLPGENETPADGAEDVKGLGYDPEGRRDPFRALTGEAADSDLRKKYEGTLKGRLLSEVKLTSILRHPSGNIATFEGGPKKEGYFAKVGDELWDGQIVSIDFNSMTVVVRQKVEDPRLIKKWRDIPIPLWTEEEKKTEGVSPQ